MSTYQPEPNSVAARVIACLKAKPEGAVATSAELSHQLGVPSSSFSACLISAVNAGLVHKQAGNGREIVWALGPRMAWTVSQPKPPAEAAEPGEVRCVIDLPTASDAEMIGQIKEASTAPAITAPADPAFACALFNDGRLYLELGDETMTLQVEHTRALLAYLERVAMP